MKSLCGRNCDFGQLDSVRVDKNRAIRERQQAVMAMRVVAHTDEHHTRNGLHSRPRSDRMERRAHGFGRGIGGPTDESIGIVRLRP